MEKGSPVFVYGIIIIVPSWIINMKNDVHNFYMNVKIKADIKCDSDGGTLCVMHLTEMLD